MSQLTTNTIWRNLLIVAILLFVATNWFTVSQTDLTVDEAVVFMFYPLFSLLNILGVWNMYYSDMALIGLIITIPAGILCVLIVTSLLLFGPGLHFFVQNTFRKVTWLSLIFLGFFYSLAAIFYLLTL